MIGFYNFQLWLFTGERVCGVSHTIHVDGAIISYQVNLLFAIVLIY